MKPRINIYLENHVEAQLTLLSKRPGLNKSRIVNDALDKFFNPERDKIFESAMLRRLDKMSKSQAKIERNESITSETLALFVRYFLTITPPLPQAEQAAAHALGKERFEVFIAQVGRRLAQDQNLIDEVLARIVDNRPDLFTGAAGDIAGAEKQPMDLIKPVEDPLPPLRPVVIQDDDLEGLPQSEQEESWLEESELEESWHEVHEEEDNV